MNQQDILTLLMMPFTFIGIFTAYEWLRSRLLE